MCRYHQHDIGAELIHKNTWVVITFDKTQSAVAKCLCSVNKPLYIAQLCQTTQVLHALFDLTFTVFDVKVIFFC